MLTSDIVNKAIEYILAHINEKISIDDVANHCHFSKYYFSRVFKAETGESVYAFIKRLKIERSTMYLSIEQYKNITDIGYDFGYSPSNYSSLFRQTHQVSPASFRKHRKDNLPAENPFVSKPINYHDIQYYDSRISIKEIEDISVLYDRYIGSYKDIEGNWCEFLEKYSAYINDDTQYIERSYDDPSVTEVDRCIYDLCITVDDTYTGENKMIIKGGRFLVCAFEGCTKEIFEFHQGIFNIWFPTSGHKLENRLGFDIYREADSENDRFRMDICIPIK